MHEPSCCDLTHIITSDIQSFRQKIKDHKAQSLGKVVPLIPFAAVNIAFTQAGLTLVSSFSTRIEIFLEAINL